MLAQTGKEPGSFPIRTAVGPYHAARKITHKNVPVSGTVPSNKIFSITPNDDSGPLDNWSCSAIDHNAMVTFSLLEDEDKMVEVVDDEVPASFVDYKEATKEAKSNHRA